MLQLSHSTGSYAFCSTPTDMWFTLDSITLSWIITWAEAAGNVNVHSGRVLSIQLIKRCCFRYQSQGIRYTANGEILILSTSHIISACEVSTHTCKIIPVALGAHGTQGQKGERGYSGLPRQKGNQGEAAPLTKKMCFILLFGIDIEPNFLLCNSF